MLYMKVFWMAFMATMGFEVALGLCIAIGAICKGASKNGKN